MATYCERCGGTLIFDPKIKKISCKLCLHTFDISEIKMIDDDMMREISSSLEDYELPDAAEFSCRIYTCKICGKEIIVTDEEESDTCIFCGSKSLEYSRDKHIKKPEFMIPFTVTKLDALRSVKDALAKERYVLPEFKDIDPGKIKSIYIPFRIVKGEHRNAAYMDGMKGQIKLFASLSGKMNFDDMLIPAPASTNRELCRRLFPLLLNTKIPFDEANIGSAYIDIPDLTSDLTPDADCFADMIFSSEAPTLCEDDIHNTLKTHPETIIDKEERYCLIPAWIYSTEYKGKTESFLINGYTGETACSVPFDVRTYKKRRTIWLISSILLTFCSLVGVVADAKSSGLIEDMVALSFATFVVVFAKIGIPVLLVAIPWWIYQIISTHDDKRIEIGTFEPTVAYLKTDGIELDSDIDYHSENRCESFFASLNKQGKSSSPFEDDIPDVLPEVNIPLFKPVKGRS